MAPQLGSSTPWLALLALAARPVQVAAEWCAQDGSDYHYNERVSGPTRAINTNGCPNHPYYNLNAHHAVKEHTEYTIPAKPVFVGATTDPSAASAFVDLSAQGGTIGILFSGAQVHSPFAGEGRGKAIGFSSSATYTQGDSFDQCGCHASSSSEPSYHCHVPPACLLEQLGQTEVTHSPQVGWALDGFPVYGPRGADGVPMQTCRQTGGTYGQDVCTDDCGGYYKDDSSIDGYIYRYYMMGEHSDGTTCSAPGCPLPTEKFFPNTMLCFRGCCPAGAVCDESVPACPVASMFGIANGQSSAVSLPSRPQGLPVNQRACPCASITCGDTCSAQAKQVPQEGALLGGILELIREAAYTIARVLLPEQFTYLVPRPEIECGAYENMCPKAGGERSSAESPWSSTWQARAQADPSLWVRRLSGNPTQSGSPTDAPTPAPTPEPEAEPEIDSVVTGSFTLAATGNATQLVEDPVFKSAVAAGIADTVNVPRQFVTVILSVEQAGGSVRRRLSAGNIKADYTISLPVERSQSSTGEVSPPSVTQITDSIKAVATTAIAASIQTALEELAPSGVNATDTYGSFSVSAVETPQVEVLITTSTTTQDPRERRPIRQNVVVTADVGHRTAGPAALLLLAAALTAMAPQC